jgi:hypothetical protein
VQLAGKVRNGKGRLAIEGRLIKTPFATDHEIGIGHGWPKGREAYEVLGTRGQSHGATQSAQPNGEPSCGSAKGGVSRQHRKAFGGQGLAKSLGSLHNTVFIFGERTFLRQKSAHRDAARCNERSIDVAKNGQGCALNNPVDRSELDLGNLVKVGNGGL